MVGRLSNLRKIGHEITTTCSHRKGQAKSSLKLEISLDSALPAVKGREVAATSRLILALQHSFASAVCGEISSVPSLQILVKFLPTTRPKDSAMQHVGRHLAFC